jgi:hypothetical protein
MSSPARSSIADALGVVSRNSIPFRPVVRRVESPSYTLRVVRPSPAQIFGIIVCVVICAAGIFGLVHYLI